MAKQSVALSNGSRGARGGWARVVRGLAGRTEMPMDIMLNEPKVTVVGRMQVQIQNHAGILLLTPEIVSVGTGSGPVTVYGSRLKVRRMTREEIVVDGAMHTVDFGPIRRRIGPGANGDGDEGDLT